ncbi:RrF2 family transcriptional regulator [Pectinatus brassicae]|uniref:Rrf2 family protein n=1 Tax=Pectinatus brassicae TaxID=862415 RepID=A0A840UI37_9FIRM|nr:Rrf2 family transcriptional regulator [Pectinatus brassicae]MBB5336659.1 Rrf2 family protein [Pectinatus brassicae]
MKLSTRGRYGVTAMYELALNYGKGPLSLRTIAAKQDISDNYLEQLICSLRNAGLVKSTRGAQGGYVLTKDPAHITIGDIITIMEGPIALVDCLLNDADSKSQVCKKAGKCVTRGVWERVCQSISDVLDSITLADLCKNNGQPTITVAPPEAKEA